MSQLFLSEPKIYFFLFKSDCFDSKTQTISFYFSFMNGDAVRFKSVFTALAVIYAADKYMVKKLDILALEFIRKNLTVNDSLMVLQHLYFLHGTENDSDDQLVQDREPSAPTLGNAASGYIRFDKSSFKLSLCINRSFGVT